MGELLQYYYPGLDVSSLNDDEFSKKVGYLFKIRRMEAEDQVNSTLKNILGNGEQ